MLLENLSQAIPIEQCKDMCVSQCSVNLVGIAINKFLFLPILASFCLLLLLFCVSWKDKIFEGLKGYLPNFDEKQYNQLVIFLLIAGILLLAAFFFLVRSGIILPDIKI